MDKAKEKENLNVNKNIHNENDNNKKEEMENVDTQKKVTLPNEQKNKIETISNFNKIEETHKEKENKENSPKEKNNTNNCQEENNKVQNPPTKKKYRKEIPISEWKCRSIDQYKILKDSPVGEGSFGKVFKAYYKGSKEYAQKYKIPELVALKLIKTQNEKEGFPITALREIMIMRRLDHKNILRLLEVITSNDPIKKEAYLVFEYMEHDLGSILLCNVKYQKSHIKFILNQLLLGLQYLHKNNVLHRDIKTVNILVNNEGGIKIGDFGLSRIFSEYNIKKYTNRVVTLWYRAPELLLGETSYKGEIDIWSLGCVFWEILTGIPLFKGDKEKEVFKKICKLLGNPDEKNWPGVSKYKNYKNIMPEKKYRYILEEKIKEDKNLNPNNFDDVTINLLKRMICINPKNRISIEDALNHPYFSTPPLMCKQEEMPKIEEELHYHALKMKYQNQIQIAKKDYNQKNNNFIGKKRKISS